MSLSAFQIALLTDALKLGVQVFSRLSGQIRIVETFDDQLPHRAVCHSREQLSATAMSVAAISDGDGYKDSGKRYFFAIENGVAKVRSPGEPFRVIAGQRTGPAIVSYHQRRSGEIRHLVEFDMIAAGAGRVLVKEKNAARFYFTVLDPQFLFRGQQTIRSAYFKLDPETGQPTADNADRLAHLADEDIRHPAAVRFPLFRLMLSLDAIDNMAVNVDRNLGVWHRIDMRAPPDGIDPPKGLSHVPKAVDLVRYAYADGSATTKKGLPIYRVLDLGVGHEHWHEQESAVYDGEMDSLAGPGLPPLLMEHDVYRFFNGPVHDKGGFIDGTANYYLLAQLVPDEVLQRGRGPDAFGILWMDEQAVFSERWRLLHPDDCHFGGFRNLVPSALVQYLAKKPWYHTIAFDRRRFFCPFRAMHIGPLSRMAVARQVIVVSGYDPQSGRHLLYTINFSFGTCDRTWRWRRLPPLHTVTGSIGSIDTDPDRLPFVHIGLREDMTLYVVQELAKVADRLRVEAERANLLGRLDRLVNPRELREQMVAVVERLVDTGLFVRTVHRRSLFHDRFLLKLVHRPPVGYILVHWDKRDDDLLPFNDPSPHRSATIAIRLRRPDGREFPAVIRSWRRVLSPPVVTRAEIRVKRSASGAPTAVSIRIATPPEGDELEENVWRVRMGALPVNGSRFGDAEIFLDVLRHERFEHDVRTSWHSLNWDLGQATPQVRDQIRRYCTEQGRQRHGTSLWFENIVGQVSTPDELTFA